MELYDKILNVIFNVWDEIETADEAIEALAMEDGVSLEQAEKIHAEWMAWHGSRIPTPFSDAMTENWLADFLQQNEIG